MKKKLLLVGLSCMSILVMGQKYDKTQKLSKLAEFKHHMNISCAKDAYSLLKTDSLWAYERTPNSNSKKKNVLKSTLYKKSQVDTAYTFPWIADKQQWDTIPTGKIVYTYDSQYNLTNYLSLTWNATSYSWQNSNQIIYTYNSANQLTNAIYQNWKNKGRGVYAWVNNVNKTSKYDSLNRKSNFVSQTWNILKNKWVNSWQQNFNYDSVGNNTQIIENTWNTSTNSWIFDYSYVNLFDSLSRNVLNTIQVMDMDASSWINALLTSITYDNKGDNISTLYQSWNTESSSWENTELDSLFYADSNHIIRSVAKLWDINQMDWYNTGQNIYKYDSLGNNIEVISQDYDPNNFYWYNNSKNLYGYDSLKTQISSAILYWNLGADNWYSGTITKLIVSYYDVLKSMRINQSSSPTLEKQAENATIEVFPNPVVDFVTVQNTNYINGIQIFDLSGNKVLQKYYYGLTNISLDISTLKSGIYVLFISSSDGSSIPKKIVKR